MPDEPTDEILDDQTEPATGPVPAAHPRLVPIVVGITLVVLGLDQLTKWRALADDVRIVFCCRAGNRSAQAARALRRLGHAQSYSLAGGLTLLSAAEGAMPRPREVAA